MMPTTRNDSETPAALVPSLLVELAAQVLPGGSRRNRYLREFQAELYGMPVRRQTAHALRILASSWSLRRATRNPNRERRTLMTMLRSKPLLCRLNLRHHWQWQSGPDGDRYERCTKCGEDRLPYTWNFDFSSGQPKR